MKLFKIIEANDESEVNTLASMHHLRWKVFSQELHWSVGLQTFNRMEFDEYDNTGTYYIVRLNDYGIVDATCRLMPTSKPYMLEEHYAHFVSNEAMPKSDTVWEFSRTCASAEARAERGTNVTAQLITAAIEFGLVHNVQQYISLTTDNVFPLLRRIVGWDSAPMGERLATPDDYSYSLKHSVSYDMLNHIRARHHIDAPLIYDFDENFQQIRSVWNDSTFIQQNRYAHPAGSNGFPSGYNCSPVIS